MLHNITCRICVSNTYFLKILFLWVIALSKIHMAKYGVITITISMQYSSFCVTSSYFCAIRQLFSFTCLKRCFNDVKSEHWVGPHGQIWDSKHCDL